jgi:hypothetical protein
VWLLSLAKSALHASINGRAKVAPLPLIDSANAGVVVTKRAEVAIATIASLLREFIFPPYVSSTSEVNVCTWL